MMTQWHTHVAGFNTQELKALVSSAKKKEFPLLSLAVLMDFEKATQLIEETSTLVLQKLKSPENG